MLACTVAACGSGGSVSQSVSSAASAVKGKLSATASATTSQTPQSKTATQATTTRSTTVTRTQTATATASASTSTANPTATVKVLPTSTTGGTSDGVPWWGWVLIALGVAGVVIGGVLLVRGRRPTGGEPTGETRDGSPDGLVGRNGAEPPGAEGQTPRVQSPHEPTGEDRR